MNTLIFLGGGWQQSPSIQEFKKLNYKILLVDPDINCDAYRLADIFYEIDIKDHEEIYNRLIFEKIDKEIIDIIAINNDVGQLSVSELENKLFKDRKNNLSTELEINTKNKIKKILQTKFGETASYYYELTVTNYLDFIDEILDKNKEKELIAKPIDGSGSKGVTKIKINSNKDEVVYAINLAIKNSLKKIIIIEEFIYGQEYSVEVINSTGTGVFIAAISRRYMNNGVSAVAIETIEYTSTVFLQIKKYVEEFLYAIKHKHGLLHIELIIDTQNKIHIIDIGQRGGGFWVADKLASDSIGINLNLCLFLLKHNIKVRLSIVNSNIKLLLYERQGDDIKFDISEYYLIDYLKLKPDQSNENKNSDASRNLIKYYHKKNILSNKMIQERSDKRVNESGSSAKSVGWSSKEQQELRFEKIFNQIDLKSTDKVLDLGCGFGDSLEYIKKKYPNYDEKNYTGIDISFNMIELAVFKNKKAQFIIGDFIDFDFKNKKFDYIICSGALNYSKKNPINFIQKFIKNFILICNKSLIFNLITSHVDFKDPILEYYDPVDILKAIQANTKKYKIDNSYNLHEFTCSLIIGSKLNQ